MNSTDSKDQLFQEIQTYFQTQPEIVAVYIFGSYAAGKEHPYSDIDLGVLIDPEKESDYNELRATYHAHISRITRRDIDLVIMNTAGEGLLKQIYERGRRIVKRDNIKLSLFNMVAYARIAEFGYHHEKMKAGLIKSITEDQSIG